jgi:hypothetical protein
MSAEVRKENSRAFYELKDPHAKISYTEGMWILSTPLREFSYLYLPGLLAVAASLVWPDLGDESLLYGILAMGIIDSGHVYTTIWRTWLHSEEVKTRSGYWFFPIFFCAGFTLWFYFELPYLWAFVVYATFYHHARQVYGFSKWYQKLNHRTDKFSDFVVYFLAIFPLLIYHFRPEAIGNYYTENDLFLYPWEKLRDVLLFFYLSGVSLWIYREVRLWREGTKELNRILSVAGPGIIYAYCFLVGTTITQILFPLLFLHGVAYFGVMGQSLSRTQKRFNREYVAILTVLATTIVFGLSESWFEENVVPRNLGQNAWLSSLIVGISLTPLFCHYAFDAVIWRKNHREARLVFASDTPELSR